MSRRYKQSGKVIACYKKLSKPSLPLQCNVVRLCHALNIHSPCKINSANNKACLKIATLQEHETEWYKTANTNKEDAILCKKTCRCPSALVKIKVLKEGLKKSSEWLGSAQALRRHRARTRPDRSRRSGHRPHTEPPSVGLPMYSNFIIPARAAASAARASARLLALPPPPKLSVVLHFSFVKSWRRWATLMVQRESEISESEGLTVKSNIVEK